ncbi:uncharacterized protein LOC133195024 [Saccostrea echinata]|uniref:uncharacterized protein LOC133195024 n=1 Tax=Saccostrea echinata TaxID=191078 RepID=UPI002A822099|nr:uncharacterized protein LOC133195024 [Saccostrea echinata]
MKCLQNSFLIFIIPLPYFSIAELPSRACEYSSQTVEPTKLCPSTQNEYNAAAKRKNCNTFKHNCTSFQYHCVLNEWMTGLVEVCAPSKFIFGEQCTEFNKELKTIRRSFLTNCSAFDPPCPNPYNSTMGYMYPDCYFTIATTSRVKELPTTLNTLNSNETSKNNNHKKAAAETTPSVIIVAVVASAFVGITIIIVFSFFLKRIKRSQTNKSSDEKTTGKMNLLHLDPVETKEDLKNGEFAKTQLNL